MRRMAAFMATGLLALTLAACGGQAQQTSTGEDQMEDLELAMDDDEEMELPPIPDDVTGGKPWIDSVVAGNVTAETETSPVDDFYLYVNKDWIVSKKIPEGQLTTDNDPFVEPRTRVMEALAGADLSEHDARQAQLLFNAFCDTEARDAAGCEPAKKVIDDIRSLKSIDEVSAFLLDTERSAGVPTLVTVTNTRNFDSHRWDTSIRLSNATFGSSPLTMGMSAATIDPASDVYKVRQNLVLSVLTRAGYTEAEAKAAFENRLEVEKEIDESANEATDEQKESQSLPLDKLDGIAGSFPVRSLAEARGYGQAKEFVVGNPADLQAVGAVWDEAHLDVLRDYLICGYALEAGGWLDTEAFDAWRHNYSDGQNDISLTMSERNRSIAETAVNLEAEIAPTLIGHAYVEGYDLEHTKEFIKDLCQDAVETHKQLVNASEWLSDSSKQHLCEKLDGVTMNVVYPDVWEDYSALNLDGLDYYGARKALWLNNLARNASLTNTEIDDRIWQSPSLISGGAAYDTDTNSFHVDAGVCEGDVARYEAGEISFAELMGGPAGYGVFHEIGHAIDNENIYFDAKGDELDNPIIDADDVEEYERRADKVKDYLDGITIWEGQHVMGEVCVKEAIAEINGMQARLAYAAQRDDFDYKAFFEKRAQLNPTLGTAEYELMWILGADHHPSCYLDTNITVQQFDEFMDAFGVKESDGMWLAPEDRLVIW